MNSVFGSGTKGGAISVQAWSKLRVSSSTFIANNVSSFINRICISDSRGGTFSFGGNTHQQVTIEDSIILGSRAQLGGAIVVSGVQNLVAPFSFKNLTILNSSATEAGGALFVETECDSESRLYADLCDLISEHALNVSAAVYGDVCASSPVALSLYQADKTKQFVASGQPTRLSFFLQDIFGNNAYYLQNYVIAHLSSTGAKMLTRSPQDKAQVGSDKLMTFDDLSIFAREGANVSVNFEGIAEQRSCPDVPLSLRLDFAVISCLPTYFTLHDDTCELCPTHTYTLDGSSGDCMPCSDGEVAEDAASEYSCLTLASTDLENGENSNPSRFWKVSEGFYPVPSLDKPEELERCPNHACLPFACEVRF
jgi:hypothetical protein